MKNFLQFVARFFASVTTGIITFFVSALPLDQSFGSSVLYGIVASVAVYYILKWIMKSYNIKSTGLTRREYYYIQRNLKEAKRKIRRLQKAFLKSSNVLTAKQHIEILRVVHKIHDMTKKEPIRFFKAEEFYFSHLDSLVEIAEKYAFLNAQPVKTPELTDSLNETRRTIARLSDTIQDDLLKVIEHDVDTLKFELDVAKRTIEKKNGNDRRLN
ncbi:MAG: 5-bromo-4-chloroindolyl phosphate hydrolysis family protein [Caldibacillus sp.]